MKTKIRTFLWRLLGVDYSHILRVTDNPYLKNDKFTTIGDATYDNNAMVYRWSSSPLSIGKYCSISYGVKFILDDGKHYTGCISSYPFSERKPNKRGIIIGNDVWIGMDTIILDGVTIGNGVTIAAGSVVTHNIPDYCIVGGVPAQIIKHKCSEDEKNKLNRIAWWDWSRKEIDDNVLDFNLTIPEFIHKYL